MALTGTARTSRRRLSRCLSAHSSPFFPPFSIPRITCGAAYQNSPRAPAEPLVLLLANQRCSSSTSQPIRPEILQTSNPAHACFQSAFSTSRISERSGTGTVLDLFSTQNLVSGPLYPWRRAPLDKIGLYHDDVNNPTVHSHKAPHQ